MICYCFNKSSKRIVPVAMATARLGTAAVAVDASRWLICRSTTTHHGDRFLITTCAVAVGYSHSGRSTRTSPAPQWRTTTLRYFPEYQPMKPWKQQMNSTTAAMTVLLTSVGIITACNCTGVFEWKDTNRVYHYIYLIFTRTSNICLPLAYSLCFTNCR